MRDLLRRKTPTERLAIGFALWRAAWKMLQGRLASSYPEWDAQRRQREVAPRLSYGVVWIMVASGGTR